MNFTGLVINVLPVYAMGMLVLSAFIAIWNIRKVISLVKDISTHDSSNHYHVDLNTGEVFYDDFPSREWRLDKMKDDWRDPKYGFGTKFLY